MTTLRLRWYAVYADALGIAVELLEVVKYGTPTAGTWTMTVRGCCGTVTRDFTETSHTSSNHVVELCERAWAEWVADTLAPGRERDEDWTEAPQQPAAPTVHHKRDGLPKVNARRTRVVA